MLSIQDLIAVINWYCILAAACRYYITGKLPRTSKAMKMAESGAPAPGWQ